ncbi:MAG: T9SS type A sorting domain-containing protein [Flavobacteriales bacterium]|nr:T9SS type A sorting domain-containing protein [Flavobacteriales bacterium]
MKLLFTTLFATLIATFSAASPPSLVPNTGVRVADCGKTVTTFNEKFYASTVTGATMYEWEFTDPLLNVITVTKTTNAMSFQYANLLQLNTTYDVRVRAYDGVDVGTYNWVCQISSPAAIQSTGVRASDCGVTVSAFDENFYCSTVSGASMYEWQFTDPSLNVTTLTSTGTGMSLLSAGLTSINVTYDVQVRAYINGNPGAYSWVCQVSSPGSVENTGLRVADCGKTVSNLNEVFYASTVAGATSYDWKFTDPSLNVTTVSNSINSMSFIDAGLTDINVTYDVEVRANVFGNVGSYSWVCQLTSPPNIPSTGVRTADCGKVTTEFTDLFYASTVAGASQYEWEFTDPSLNVTTVINNNSSMSFALAGLMTTNTEYNVRVRAYVSGIPGNYSWVCQLRSPSSTGVRQSDCGITVTYFNDKFYCSEASGATMYEWEFTDPSLNVTTMNNSTKAMSFQLAGLNELNTTYNVRVRAYVGGVWGDYSWVCQLSTPTGVPSTGVRVADCGASMSSFLDKFYASTVSGATMYEWEFTDPSLNVTTVTGTTKAMSFYWAGISDLNTTFNVRVRAYVNGIPGNYSWACQLISPATAVMIDSDPLTTMEKSGNLSSEDLKEELSFVDPIVYPNPFYHTLNVDFGSNGMEKEIRIYNSLGQILQTLKTSDVLLTLDMSEFDQGVYLMQIVSEEEMRTIRLVKK